MCVRRAATQTGWRYDLAKTTRNTKNISMLCAATETRKRTHIHHITPLKERRIIVTSRLKQTTKKTLLALNDRLHRTRL